MSGILIIGAGGHSKVIADILQLQNKPVLGFLDDNAQRWGQQWFGLPVLGGILDFARFNPTGLILGIGSNQARQTIAQRLPTELEQLWVNAIHPRATVAASVTLGQGVAVMANVAINPDTIIGDHVIINTGATTDHDCQIADYAHIAPGVHLTGSITVGEGVLVGAGAATVPGVRIGAWSVIGTGAVVTKDIPDHVVAKGIPARWSIPGGKT